MLTSLGFAAFEDYKAREVHNFLWIPALLATLIFYGLEPQYVYLFLIWTVGIISIGSYLIFRGFLGYADVYGILFALTNPFTLLYPIPVILFSATALAAGMGYRLFTFKSRYFFVPIDRFRKEKHWLPLSVEFEDGRELSIKHDVNVARQSVLSLAHVKVVKCVTSYPVVTYVFVGYLVYFIGLLLFQQQLLIQTP